MRKMTYDITIIGGGPVGLFAGAMAAEMGAKCHLLESRCQLGGIMMAAYPDKNVYNFPGIPVISGRELILELINRVKSFGVDLRQGEYVEQISGDGNSSLAVMTNRGEYLSRAVLLTTGLKTYLSPLVEYIHIENWEGAGIYENWPSLDEIKEKSIAVLCGVSGEFELPAELEGAGCDITVVCDENVLSGSQVGLNRLDGIKVEAYRKPWRIRGICGDSRPEFLLLFDDETGEEKKIVAQVIVGLYKGYSRQTLFSNWGIEMVGQNIKVDQKMRTNMKRIYAAGDIAWYPGKIKLLSSGIHEVKIALKNMLKDFKTAIDINELKRREND